MAINGTSILLPARWLVIDGARAKTGYLLMTQLTECIPLGLILKQTNVL